MFKFINFFAPEVPDSKGAAAVSDEPKGTSKEDIIEFLGDDEEEDKKPIKLEDDKADKAKQKGKGSDDSDEEVKEDGEEDDEAEEETEDDLSDLEEELEDVDDEKLELVTPVRRKEILAKYPKLFKDFPYLETAYYREQEYTKILPTINDARQAVEDQTILRNFESDLEKGNTETILKAVKSNNPKAFAKAADDYLGTLARVDEKAYHHVLGNVLKHTILQMLQESRASKNDILQEAAQVLNQFVFGSSNFSQPTKLSSDEPDVKDDKAEELTKREQAIAERAFKSANDGLDTKVNNRFRATIDANIDPRESMSPYVRKNASRECYETLTDLVGRDNRFKQIVDKLWEKAAQDDYSKASIDRIEAAFVSKAKTLLPSVLKKARNEALRGMGKRVREDVEEKDTTPSKRRSSESPKREEKDRSRPRSDPKSIPAGMSTLEYMMSDD